MIESDTAETMEKNIDQIIRLALTGGLLAILVLWFFLNPSRVLHRLVYPLVRIYGF